MQEAREEERGRYSPVEGATCAVGVDGPDYAVAVWVEEGAVLLKDLSCQKCERLVIFLRQRILQSDVGASLSSHPSQSHAAHLM